MTKRSWWTAGGAVVAALIGLVAWISATSPPVIVIVRNESSDVVRDVRVQAAGREFKGGDVAPGATVEIPINADFRGQSSVDMDRADDNGGRIRVFASSFSWSPFSHIDEYSFVEGGGGVLASRDSSDAIEHLLLGRR
ncbi:MAG: hypothetical protein K8T90_11670 [Planctomycetes bacterium]|nr:hypothetical protein [Planctomycetota bacterium]